MLILAGYLLGQRLAARAEHQPGWKPVPPGAPATPVEQREEPPPSLGLLWARFFGLALVLGLCGYLVGETGVALAQQSGLSETAVGSLLTAVATSLPELVTAVAAVRQGALALAVGDILGGNAFDTLLVSFSDIAYRPGSLFAELSSEHVVVIGVAQALTGLVLLGQVRRERHGPGNIGFESVACLVVYAASALVILS